MIKIFGKLRYHWQPEFATAVLFWSLTFSALFFSLAVFFDKQVVSRLSVMLMLVFLVLLIVGLHRYFVMEGDTLSVAKANLLGTEELTISEIEKVEVRKHTVTILFDNPQKKFVYSMRKWPKKYFINALAINPYFQGEIELSDHMKEVDYFELYYKERG